MRKEKIKELCPEIRMKLIDIFKDKDTDEYKAAFEIKSDFEELDRQSFELGIGSKCTFEINLSYY